MIVDSAAYSGRCVCGREHSMTTRAAVIEAGCLKELDGLLARYGLRGKRCALYGENSYRATAGRRPRAEREIVLPSQGLHADENATARVLERLEPDTRLVLAVGSGTIHDIARYCAHKRGLPFVSIPTAATVDGFCSTVAAMTWRGYKTTLPAAAPVLVAADLDVIRAAPPELIRSGVGDILAKYIALADWKIAHLVTGEYLCPRILDIMRQAVDTVTGSVSGLLEGREEAFQSVTYALVMSGIAMQMMGNSRPASGAEHHISHMIEMGPEALNVAFPAMHGEKTGVGAVLAAREYERLSRVEDIGPYITDYRPLDEGRCRTFFGEKLIGGLLKENERDCLAQVEPERLAAAWPEIRRILSEIPPSGELYALLERLGAKRSLEDVGVSSRDLERVLAFSPLVRNRLTLMRMRRMIEM